MYGAPRPISNGMDLFIGIAVFLFGAIIGSFLNVVILRWNTGRSLSGRSHCLSCGHTLSFIDLVPFLGFFLCRGACRYCGSRISRQYPLVEFATGFLFLILFYFVVLMPEAQGGSWATSSIISLFYGWTVISLLVLIAAYDMYHKIIPDAFVYTLVGLSFAGLFFDFQTLEVVFPNKEMILAGPVLAAPLALLWLMSHGRWMGFGDAKLELALGWFLGMSKGIAALLISFWAGALAGLGLMALGKIMSRHASYGWKSELAFGPFLILGFLIVWIGNISLPELLTFFFL